MKHILILIVLLLGGTSLQAQDDAIARYFGKYMDDDNFTSIYISKKMFSLIARMDEDADPESKEVIENLAGLRILVREDAGDSNKFYEEAITMIPTETYEELMTIRNADENIRFLIKEKNDKISELLMLIAGEEDFVLISIIGDIELDKISVLADNMEIDGMEHLKSIDEK